MGKKRIYIDEEVEERNPPKHQVAKLLYMGAHAAGVSQSGHASPALSIQLLPKGSTYTTSTHTCNCYKNGGEFAASFTSNVRKYIYSNMYRYVYIYSMLYTHTALSNLRSLWLLLIVSHFYKRTQRKRKKTQTGICYIKYGFFLSRFPLQTRLGYCTLKQCLASLSLYFSMSLFI